jgi:hypothetical protein
MNLGDAPPSNLLHCYRLCGIPQRIASVLLKAVLCSHGQNSKQQLGGSFGGRERGKVQEGQVFVKTTNVALEESRQSMPRREHKVIRENGRKFIQSVLDHGMIGDRNA